MAVCAMRADQTAASCRCHHRPPRPHSSAGGGAPPRAGFLFPPERWAARRPEHGHHPPHVMSDHILLAASAMAACACEAAVALQLHHRSAATPCRTLPLARRAWRTVADSLFWPPGPLGACGRHAPGGLAGGATAAALELWLRRALALLASCLCVLISAECYFTARCALLLFPALPHSASAAQRWVGVSAPPLLPPLPAGTSTHPARSWRGRWWAWLCSRCRWCGTAGRRRGSATAAATRPAWLERRGRCNATELVDSCRCDGQIWADLGHFRNFERFLACRTQPRGGQL